MDTVLTQDGIMAWAPGNLTPAERDQGRWRVLLQALVNQSSSDHYPCGADLFHMKNRSSKHVTARYILRVNNYLVIESLLASKSGQLSCSN
jgi:hypothetical protein